MSRKTQSPEPVLVEAVDGASWRVKRPNLSLELLRTRGQQGPNLICPREQIWEEGG